MALTLEIKKRDKTTKARALRREGIVPATIYGPDTEPRSIQLAAKNFRKISFADQTRLIALTEEGGTNTEVLIKDVQKDHLSGELLNIEFYQVNTTNKLNARVFIKFVGNSEAVKLGADFAVRHKEVHIRCLPKYLPAFVEVDISVMVDPEDSITFGDLDLGEHIEVLDQPNDLICKAETKRKDHTIDPVPVAAAVDPAAPAAAAPAAAAPAKAAPAKK